MRPFPIRRTSPGEPSIRGREACLIWWQASGAGRSTAASDATGRRTLLALAHSGRSSAPIAASDDTGKPQRRGKILHGICGTAGLEFLSPKPWMPDPPGRESFFQQAMGALAAPAGAWRGCGRARTHARQRCPPAGWPAASLVGRLFSGPARATADPNTKRAQPQGHQAGVCMHALKERAAGTPGPGRCRGGRRRAGLGVRLFGLAQARDAGAGSRSSGMAGACQPEEIPDGTSQGRGVRRTREEIPRLRGLSASGITRRWRRQSCWQCSPGEAPAGR